MKIQIEAEPGELHAKGAALLGQLRRAIAADAPTGHTCGPACGHGADAPDLAKATRIPKTAEAAAERLAAIPLPTVRTIVERAQAAGRSLARTMTPVLREALADGPTALMKAKRGGDPPKPLTLAEISIIAQLIRDGHVRLAVSLFGADAVSKEAIDGAIKRGVLKQADLKRAGITGIVGGGYNLGVKMVSTPAAAAEPPPPEVKPGQTRTEGGGAKQPPGEPSAPDIGTPDDDLPRWQRAYATAARRHGAQMVVGLGNRVADGVAGNVIEVDQAQERKYREAIAESVAAGIEAAKTWKQVRGDLGGALDGDWTRDLDRIAATETQAAVNQGYMDTVREDYGTDVQVAVIPDAGACPVCLGDYLDNGRPRIYAASALPPSSVNFQRKAAEQVACIPPRHPWCACQLVYVEPGWAFDATWELVPAEVVAERDAAPSEAP